ncbi:MAG TPA: dihydropteroate synthase, partial [Candidatus Limnocylindrales bacterium]|nr:dihydropteroate synthase [Candidatus Limnocylindrales bacterium]
MDAVPGGALPSDVGQGIPDQPPSPVLIHDREFVWGARTYVLGIINVTPDSFSGDGIMSRDTAVVQAAVEQARRMVDDGADILDIGGESTRPGHADVSSADEKSRVIPVVRAVRAALPEVPISIDSTKADVAAAALEAGADVINDIWGTGASDAMAGLAAERNAPMIVMHNR